MTGRALSCGHSLSRDTGGVAMVEFAFMAPILLLLGLAGIELANFSITHMRVSQAAMHLADNASRIGDRDQLAAQRIYESDLNDLFVGVNIQAGRQLELLENGRVIVSSLERNADGGQTIRWQRCMGRKVANSAFGGQGTGATGTGFAGMGRTGNEVQAEPGQSVMFVEVFYDYQPLMVNDFTTKFILPPEIRSNSAFIVRGARDLTGVFQRSPAAPVSSCNKFQAVP
ncbi:MAG: TadE/TadG family type IV pilus assembly protein [Sphingomonadaceae bacterium]